MAKAVISNRIMLNVEASEISRFDDTLTYEIPSYREDRPPQIIKNMKRVKSGLISIPVGRTDLIPKGYEIVDKRVDLPVTFPEFRFELRPSQQEVYDKIEGNAVINASVSWGKTFTALAIAGKLQQKTLIVTHTIALRTQWENDVVGNVQTLYKVKDEIATKFGTLIVDECHHIPANTFNKLVDASYARYKIGLSGTVERKDGRHVLLPDYFGYTKFVPPAENYMKPRVDIIQSSIRFMDGRTPWALRVNDLVANEEYGKLVAMLAAIYKSKGHKVLLVSDRVNFLKRLKLTIGKHAVIITGENTLEEREERLTKVKAGKVDILLGTQAIFAEGISVNPLSCLILATPVNNTPLLTQLIGRVVRERVGRRDYA
jgi:superfamily II DNA or RNA helicase